MTGRERGQATMLPADPDFIHQDKSHTGFGGQS